MTHKIVRVPFRRLHRIAVDGPKPRSICAGKTRGNRLWALQVVDDPFGLLPEMRIVVENGLMVEVPLAQLVGAILDAQVPSDGGQLPAELSDALSTIRAMLAGMGGPSAGTVTGMDLYGRALDEIEWFATEWWAIESADAAALPETPE